MPEYTNFAAVCPYCGHEDRDVWELELSDGETTYTPCPSCGKVYAVTAHISVEYSTFPVSEEISDVKA